MEETGGTVRRQILDDIFDAFAIIAGGNYVSLYDIKGKMTRYTPAAVELFGLPGEYIPEGAYDWSDYVHPEDLRHYETVMGGLLTGDSKVYNLTYRVRLKDGGYALFRFIGSVLRDESGAPELVGGIMINEGLMENTDPVTVLRNQYGFFTDLRVMMEMRKKGVILYTGFNGLGDINETYGYGYGNHVLGQVGWLLQEELGQYGTVYRMDGVRFAFLTDRMSAEEVEKIYEKLRRRLLGGIQVENDRLDITANGGMISVAGRTINERTILSCVNYAYRESKQNRNGRLVIFDGRKERGVETTLEMIDTIRESVINDCEGFSLVYQPVVDVSGEHILGLEALLRWKNQKYGTIAPTEYVRILERDFIFEELGYWILQRAMRDGKKLLEQNPELIIGVNIAQVQPEDEFFVDELTELSEQTGFPLGNLSVELTQGCRQLNVELLENIIGSLREKGVRVVIDDFGSGTASVDYLRGLSADYVKLDRKYINNIAEDERTRKIMGCLTEIAAVCGTVVCVKGVETAQIRDIVKQYPVRGFQGNYYCEPLPPEQILERYENGKNRFYDGKNTMES